jgi:hypothetical protein
MSKIGREGTTRTTTRITQKNDLDSIKNTKQTTWIQQQSQL